MERGPAPIEESLASARFLFGKVILPTKLPADLKTLHDAQQRWIGRVLDTPNQRPRYRRVELHGDVHGGAVRSARLGGLAENRATGVAPGRPYFCGLAYLHQARITSAPPASKAIDEGNFAPKSYMKTMACLKSSAAKDRIGA